MTGPLARIAVWSAVDLAPGERRARRRGTTPPPMLVEEATSEEAVVVGRRRSRRDSRRTEEHGVLRIALDQIEKPFTSKRHLEVRWDAGWAVSVVTTARRPAMLRSWGDLTWTTVAPGARWPLRRDLPVAVLLPGSPGYVVSILATDDSSDSFLPTSGPPAGAPRAAEAVPGSRSGSAGETSEVTTPIPSEARPGAATELQSTELVTLLRSFRTCLQWPPRPEDDDEPAWTGAGIRHPEALRMAYRRLYARLREPLGLPDRLVRGADLQLVTHLVDKGDLTPAGVAEVAASCDLDLDLTALWARSADRHLRSVP